MTGENKSVLKTRLGLENLKGLSETIKQVTELQKSLNESKQALTDLLEANSPIAKAIADRLGAETLQSLKESDITALEELKAKLEEEIKKAKEVINAVTQENQQLKEALQAKTTREIIREELDSRLPKGGTPGGDDKLTTAINSLVAERLNALVGGGQQGNFTAEDIRKIIGEEVAKATQGNNSPDQVTENIIKMLTVSDTVKQKLGISEGSGISRLLPQGGDSGLRTDLVKVLLEDERERLKIAQNHEAETQRNKHLGTIAGAVKENLGTGIAALTAAAEEIRRSPSGAKTPASTPPQVFRCGDCQTQFSPPAGWKGQPLKCPSCGREYTKEELEA